MIYMTGQQTFYFVIAMLLLFLALFIFGLIVQKYFGKKIIKEHVPEEEEKEVKIEVMEDDN